MTNPKRSRKRRSNKSYRARSRRRSRNPKLHFGSRSRRHRNSFFRRSRRRRNPSFGGMDVKEILTVGASAALGGLGARSLTQLVLQSNNTSYVGYAGNLVASLLMGWVGHRFLGRNIGLGLAAGGVSATVLRIWQEQVSQSSPSSMSGLGDLDFSINGLGEYAASVFPLPTSSVPVTTAGGQHLLTPAPVAAVPAAAAKGVHGLGRATGRFPSRYN